MRPVDDVVIASDGIPIAYRRHGGDAGRPLVLLHGGGANLESMDQYAERFDDGRPIVAIDARLCGQSGDPVSFRWADAAADVDLVVRRLGFGPVDVVGHSMGGFVGGFYATDHPEARLVSIDGFGPGMPVSGDEAARAEFAEFQNGMREAFWAMTSPPESGDRAWRDAEMASMMEVFTRIGYTAPNAAVMAARNFVDLGDGRYRRHPARLLFEGGFADGGDDDVLRMYRRLAGPALIVRCTRSGAPDVLDRELDALVASNHNVEVVRLPLTHLAQRGMRSMRLSS
jgi:pimeloyl-ACP methyl ester carboxylesterase